MSNWLALDETEWASVKESSSAGVKTVISESPFNVPEALRLDVHQNPHRVVLDVRYLGDTAEIDEPVKRNKLSPRFCVFDGKNSHRIYRIEIADEVKFDEAMITTFEDIIRDFDKQHVRPKTLGRYQVLIDAWKRVGESLLRDMKARYPTQPTTTTTSTNLGQSAF